MSQEAGGQAARALPATAAGLHAAPTSRERPDGDGGAALPAANPSLQAGDQVVLLQPRQVAQRLSDGRGQRAISLSRQAGQLCRRREAVGGQQRQEPMRRGVIAGMGKMLSHDVLLHGSSFSPTGQW